MDVDDLAYEPKHLQQPFGDIMSALQPTTVNNIDFQNFTNLDT